MSEQPEVDGRLRRLKWLETLYEASSRGKWYAENVPYASERSAWAVVMLDNGDRRHTSIFDTMNADEVEIHEAGCEFGEWYDLQGQKNAAFTAEAHNEMPWLAACVRELVEMEATTRAAAAELAKCREDLDYVRKVAVELREQLGDTSSRRLV